MDKTVNKITNDLIAIWFGFCLGWSYFETPNGWTITFNLIIGLAIIIVGSFIVNYFIQRLK